MWGVYQRLTKLRLRLADGLGFSGIIAILVMGLMMDFYVLGGLLLFFISSAHVGVGLVQIWALCLGRFNAMTAWGKGACAV